ncbi:molybdopterin-dependent oxidoreductase [Spirilliplanes yamanashiensis]|uniref:Biotin transporter BioY n=1 Tax=Spirilliplanes yamanashiensis TaxID=42233 RepID=A0A8J4DHC1_9ACTN|nr:molybdopterin-dependent oxidoreductase [Spirilliplanes yamanashiensis]MDP9819170.1 biotin/methionine sulfoxide reductase [Spirilliplanes yamanashiensis]GIJ02007.1 biotin transporter BioY [Spirilliplanes yamanashiensis]
MTASSSSHWGAFLVDGTGSGLTVRPRPGDPDPSPLLGNIAGAHRHPSRVARPAVRKGWLERGPGPDPARGDEAFVEVGWDTALDLVAAELRRVRRDHGDSAVYGGSYGWASAGRFHHAQSQLNRFLALGGGCTRSVNSYSLGASLVVLPHIVGRRGAHAVIRRGTDWPVIAAHTDLLVAFGGVRTATTFVTPGGRATHDVRGHLRAATARGLRVTSVSPLRDDLAGELRGDWLPVRPGTDVAVMLALAHVLVRDGLADHDFLASHTVGADRFLASLAGRTPAWAAGVAGIAAGDIERLAHRMAAGRTLVTVSWSLQRAPHGEQPLWAGLALAALLGQIGLPGGGFGHGYGSMGDVGGGTLPYGLPTFPQPPNPVPDVIPCALIADLLLRPGETFDYDGGVHTFADTRLVYWAGGNPFHHHQDLARLRTAFARPDTVVVHEPYWTATARHADVVLPVTTTLEREDLGAGRGDTHLVAMQRADAPYAEARDEYAIFAALAGRLGYADAFTEGRTARQWLEHLYEGWRADKGLPPFAEFWAAGELALPGRRDDTVLFAGFRAGEPLDTPSGRIELHSATVAGFGYPDCPGGPTWFPPPASAYPLSLICNQPAGRLHSQLDMGAESQRRKVRGREPVRLHPADAAARGIADGDLVRVHNDVGSVLAGAALDDACRPGVAQLSTGAWFDHSAPDVATCVHGNPNALTADAGTSRLAQGCTGQVTAVEITRYDGPVPPLRTFTPPLETA